MQEKLKALAAQVRELNPNNLAELLEMIARRMSSDAAELRAGWQDDTAGKVWDIAAAGLDRTATRVRKYWATL